MGELNTNTIFGITRIPMELTQIAVTIGCVLVL